MKRVFVLLATLVLALSTALSAQDNDLGGELVSKGDAGTSQYRLPLPRVDSIPSDWDTEFKSDSARRDFKRLREYRAEKQELLNLARPHVDIVRSRREQIEVRMGATDRLLRELSGVLRGVTPADTGAVRVESQSFEFDAALGYPTPGMVPAQVLRALHRQLQEQDAEDRREAARVDSLHQKLLANIDNLEDDRRQAEAAIDSALAPEYQSQKFRLWVSGFFSLLIAAMIVSFFLTIYKKGGDDIAKDLLSDGGLQFVTIFVLIIAIILFGILDILEGRELAAILSGIAGYILGRGARIRSGQSSDDRQSAPPAPPPSPGGSAAEGSAPAPEKEKVPAPVLFPHPETAGSSAGKAGEVGTSAEEGKAGAPETRDKPA